MFKSKYATQSLSSIRTSQNQGNVTCQREDDIVDIYNYPDGKPVTIRLFGPIMTVAKYWVRTRRKDGKMTQFTIGCTSWDPMNNTRDPSKEDPWRDYEQQEYDEGIPRAEHKVSFTLEYYSNAIIRSIQERKPRDPVEPSPEEAETHFKEKDSDSWTPVRVVKLPISVLDKIQKYKSLNTARSRKTGQTMTFDLNHEKAGCDVTIIYDKKQAGAAKYSVNKDSRTPLTEEEMNYLVWDLDKLYAEYSIDDIQASFDSWHKRLVQSGLAKASTAAAASTYSKPADDFDDAEEIAPVKKAVPAKKAKKVEQAPEDFDAGFDEEDESFDDGFDNPADGSDEPWNSSEDSFDEEPKKQEKSAAKKDNDFDDLDDFDDL